jgi:hypothetical protein
MADITLTSDEAKELRIALSTILVRERTGEIGITHGLERFVSTNITRRKPELAHLDAVARKIGLGALKRFQK